MNWLRRFFKSNDKAEATISDQVSPEIEVAEDSPPTQPYRDYADFCRRMEPLVEEYQRNFRQRLPSLPRKPLISILVPVFDPDTRWLDEAIRSVLAQIYPNWELCIADDRSEDPQVRALLEKYAREDDRIHVVFRDENGHISRASNSALELASGEFAALLDHDDLLSPHALARVVDCINEHPEAEVIYSDEDKIDEQGNRSQPHFKSDWNPDLLLGQNFVSHLGVYRISSMRAIGGFRAGFEGAQDWDLVLRVSARTSADRILHIPEVLYHWRSTSGSTARDIGEKDYAHVAARRVLDDYFATHSIDAELEPVDRFYWRPKYKHDNPSVAIIVPTRDRVDLLRSCIGSVLSKTSYPDFKIIIADNESEEAETASFFQEIAAKGVDIVKTPGEFNFSRINNLVIKDRPEPIVCLLNNDTEVINSSWLDELVMHACRTDIGPVGGKLLFPHDHVQHAGIVLGIGGIGSEAFKYIHKSDDGYIHRAFLVGNYSAVTGACLAVRKSVWEAVGGFNETETPNAYSDVDFCLRCGESGFRTVFTPFAQLVHDQSSTRGSDGGPAFDSAVAYMDQRWRSKIDRDPFYNANLTLEREDFTLAFPPRGYSTK